MKRYIPNNSGKLNTTPYKINKKIVRTQPLELYS